MARETQEEGGVNRDGRQQFIDLALPLPDQYMLQYLSPDPPSLSPTILSPSTPDSALTPGGWVQPTMPYSPSTPA